jgi:hypothetical protein
MDFLEDRIGNDGQRVNAIRRWIDEQEKPGRVAIDAQIRYLEVTREWTYREIKKRKGTKDIYELVIKANKIQYRPLGFYGPEPGQFTILLGAKEKDWELEKGADRKAEGYKEIVLSDRSRIREHKYS